MLATVIVGVNYNLQFGGFLSERGDGRHCTSGISGCHWLQISGSERMMERKCIW